MRHFSLIINNIISMTFNCATDKAYKIEKNKFLLCFLKYYFLCPVFFVFLYSTMSSIAVCETDLKKRRSSKNNMNIYIYIYIYIYNIFIYIYIHAYSQGVIYIDIRHPVSVTRWRQLNSLEKM